jgi:mono/diheme cytochrome c family protein
MRTPLALLAASVFLTAADDAVFTATVKPILDRSCIECHGDKKQKGGLRLDSLEAIRKGGRDMGPAIVAGKADESPLLKVVTMPRDADMAMPPDGKGDPLKPEDVAAIKTWIAGLK